MQKKFKVGLVCFLAILALTCMGYFSYGWYASFQKLTGTEFGVANEWWLQVVTKDSNGKINGSEISAIVTAFLYMPVQTFIGAVVLIVALLNYRELGRQIESNEKSQKITEILEMISIIDEKLSSDIKI
uniref:Uncharacterized protein n=1 Tax=viral metagenome TaxID=1070528 RepID=A0A6M3LI33_9ZZZZ